MYELKSHLPKSIVLIIILGIFSITVSGYILFFQSQKRILSKDREYELLKEKQMHAQENYSDLQKKHDNMSEQLKQHIKDYEIISLKQQECKEKLEEIQIKFDQLIKEKAAHTPSPTAYSNTLTPNSPTPNNASGKIEQSNNTPSQATVLSPHTITSDIHQCPSVNTVIQNVSNGSWTDKKLIWFVDYVSRPLNENEKISNLFKILFDGQTIACYYRLGGENEGSNMIIKGGAKANKISLAEKDGWTACTNDDCQSICSDDNLTRCHFKVAP